MNTSNLACQTLGYERASGDFISVEGKYVSGIENIDCTSASDFLHCTSNTLNFSVNRLFSWHNSY